MAPRVRVQSRQMGTLGLGHQTLAEIWSTMGNSPSQVPPMHHTPRHGIARVSPLLPCIGPFLDHLEGSMGSMAARSRTVAPIGDRRRTPHAHPPTDPRLSAALIQCGPCPLAIGCRHLAIPCLPKGTSLEHRKMRGGAYFCLFQAAHICGPTHTGNLPASTQASQAQHMEPHQGSHEGSDPGGTTLLHCCADPSRPPLATYQGKLCG